MQKSKDDPNSNFQIQRTTTDCCCAAAAAAAVILDGQNNDNPPSASRPGGGSWFYATKFLKIRPDYSWDLPPFLPRQVYSSGSTQTITALQRASCSGI